MEPFQRGPGKHKGVEILYFEDAQIEKVKGNDISFAGFGSLHVLYFKDYNRFVLLLNNWIYPLLRRLIISSSPVKDDPSSRTYVLPALNCFSFELKINKVANSIAFENFETILEHNSRFSVFGKEIPYRKLEASPDDKVLRRASINTTPKEIISETVKKVLHQVQNKTATLKTGTKDLTSTKKRIQFKDIKNKNFKKDAHSRIKKGFFEANQKLLNEFLQRRKTNPNLTEAKNIEELKNTSDSQAPSLFISKEELEEFILRNRGIYGYLHQPEEVEVRRGLMTNLRDGARDIRNRVRNALNREKNVPSTEHVETLPLPDVSHYSG